MLNTKISIFLCCICVFVSIEALKPTNCNRSCGSQPVKSLPSPFGFSSSCQIPLNCSADGNIFINEFQVQSFSSENILVNLPANCKRPINSISQLFSRNYAPTSRNGILLRNCSSPMTGCTIPTSAINPRFDLVDCGTNKNNSISCYSEQNKSSLFLDYTNLTSTRCESFFSSISTELLGNNSAMSLDFQVVQLEWWINGNCRNCSESATCIHIVSPLDGTDGYRCRCFDEFVGDGYRGGSGCRKASNFRSCNPMKFLLGRCGGTTRIGVIIGGISISLLVLTLGISWICWIFHKRKIMKRRKEFFQHNGGFLLKEELSKHKGSVARIFTVEELKMATNNFDRSKVIGQGGFGIVYKGLLPDNTVVAIKKSKITEESQVKQFINEVVILSQINHRNVVKLLGCCLETQVPLVVYEFISNGTLFDHIHDQLRISSLSWEMRLKIAVETATALAYLHSETSIPIIHRDIKSANILLDEYFTAKVSDFGASRLIPLDMSKLTTLVQGTFGYLDPEYFYTSQLTEKSDVYSFGAVLLELLTGEKAVCFDRTEEHRNLAMYFMSMMEEECPFEGLENMFVEGGNIDQMKAVAVLAKRCLKDKGGERPKMKEVATELEEIAKYEDLQESRNLHDINKNNFKWPNE